MARRSDHTREELQELILQSAILILKDDGKEALTARNISEKAGYAPGTIYHVYGSMNGLTLHINAYTMDILYEALISISAKEQPDAVVKNLLKLATSYRKFITENKNLWLFLFETSLPEDRASINWYQDKIDRLFELIENILMPTMTKEEPQKIRVAARILWSSFHGLCYLEEKGQFRTIGKTTTLADMTETLVGNFMIGIKSNKDPKKI